MEKARVSMKVCKGFRHVFSAGYCDLQAITGGTYSGIIQPAYYNCGVYGWNCDLYIDYPTDSIITTGYRNMRGAMIPREIIDEYSRRADAIRARLTFDNYDSIKNEFLENFTDFCRAVIERIDG